jgi:hypothetical protein
MNKSLTEIANLHGTDKGTIGPSASWGAHNYTDIYGAYLERYRKSPINLLEIGLGVTGKRWDALIVHGRNTGGASLKMWYDYFEKAKIYGIDVNECSYLDNDRIKTYVADQGNVEELDTFVKTIGDVEIDVIVDDGSHRPDHQQISFSYFFKKLKSKGLYFIEDLLSNGLGDDAKGRMACDSVINTRNVFRNYLQHGNFSEPNALLDMDYLYENIDFACFHTPQIDIKLKFRPNILRPLKKVLGYEPNKESLCVIGKK